MNRYPLWKYLLILLIAGLGILYSLPNLYPPDPAVQISGQRSNMTMDQSILDRAEAALSDAGIAMVGGEVNERNVLLRLERDDEQLAARDVIKNALGDEYIAALNKASNTPEWLAGLGGEPMKLGLDLSGGIHFLLQVDTSDRLQQEVETQISNLKEKMREEQIRGVRITVEDPQNIVALSRDEESRSKLKQLVRSSEFRALSFPESKVESEQDGLYELRLQASDSWVKERVDSWVKQNLQSLRKRVNELGVSEPIVQQQGRDRIMVQLPGIQDTAEAQRIINKTATLEFRLEARNGGQTFPFKSEPGRSATLERKAITTGEAVIDASSGLDQNGGPMVSIRLNTEGGNQMGSTTLKNVGHPMAILFVEQNSKIVKGRDADGNEIDVIQTTETKEIISLATIQGVFGASFQITGLDSVQEARELALLLRAGALAAPMVIVESRTIGPSLGQENIELGVTSVQLGMVMVLLFMLVYYKAFGIVANVALAMNLVILVATMSLFGAILTLPGIAGIVLTVGMAVDANVLIFSRIKEELKNGLSPQQAISAGYDRAFVSIFDANITTLIVALILFLIGSGPVKGFAVTLSIGIVTSMFTSIMGTRALVNATIGGKKLQKLWI
ncbi:protein translocase subunit SecD [Porticoccus sp. W117]|uniref:protein translocase subunit SecD n=1 Tax=Porticoccus sp. W117 TaxID=3054777 RepID=UPI002595995E|nr:protein translocase subunit SecD [Porticoccus sp. W117]MDM3869998.1 protein translocase subunit SecD [Porticoccus sp. W117]